MQKRYLFKSLLCQKTLKKKVREHLKYVFTLHTTKQVNPFININILR